jgi:hypothetical protein
MKQKINIHRRAQSLADLTKNILIQGDFKRAQKCFQLAEKILKQGNAEMRNAVVNVYLYSVTSFMEVRCIKVSGLLGGELLTEYYKQVNTSGL